VLLLTCHDLGRHLGCYGVQSVHTPHLDALAAAGVRFTRAFSTASGCSPARSALATGRYPHSNGVMGLVHPPFSWDLAPTERHIAEILGAAGYETHLFGLQHVSRRTERLGFHHVHPSGGPALSSFVSSQIAAFLQGQMSGRPLYIEANLEEVHRPYEQGGALADEREGVSVPAYLPDDAASRAEMAGLQGALRQADAGVGQVLASLQQAGLSDDTLLLFTTDHGIAMPRAKCTLYDAGLEIALLVRWPHGGLAEGGVFGELVSNVDLLPTILEALALPVPEGIQGQSFLSLLRGISYVARSAVHAEKTFHSYYDPVRAIRTARFKYMRNFETAFSVEVPGDVQVGPIFRSHVELYHGAQHPPVELYDLEADPLEQHNLAGDPRYADAERRLDADLWGWMAQTADPLLDGPVESPSYREARKARAAAFADGPQEP
jgi:arylsulfatase A-like enzyme